MGIKFRHDAAAVVPPTNSASRKYGQSLVLQQNQQKYNAQQAGYDRLFQLGRDYQQNAVQFARDADQKVFQLMRDVDQQTFQKDRDKAQNDFQTERDKAQFAQEDKQTNLKNFAAARDLIGQRAQKMLDSGQITNPALAKEIQDLIDGKRIVSGINYNADEQQEYLNKYSTELSGKLSQVPPPPTPEEQLISQIGEEKYAQYGHLYEQNEKGKWVFSKDLADREDKQREREEAMRPKSFEEYYNPETNKGAFEKGLAAAKSSLEEAEADRAAAAEEEPKQITQEQALEQMQKDYAFQQKVFGKVGEPTLETKPPPQRPATSRTTPNDMYSILESPQNQGTQEPPQSPVIPPATATEPVLPPTSSTPPRTDWKDTMAASGGQPTPALPTPAAPQASAGQPTPAAPSQAASVPDFGSLMAGTKKPEDRQLYNALRGMYGSQPPDVQAAINAVVDSGGTDGAFLAAKQYLKSKGIDIDQLAMPTVPGGGRKGRAK